MNVAFASPTSSGILFLSLSFWSLPLGVGGPHLCPRLLIDRFPQVSVIFFLLCHFLFLLQIQPQVSLGKGEVLSWIIRGIREWNPQALAETLELNLVSSLKVNSYVT